MHFLASGYSNSETNTIVHNIVTTLSMRFTRHRYCSSYLAISWTQLENTYRIFSVGLQCSYEVVRSILTEWRKKLFDHHLKLRESFVLRLPLVHHIRAINVLRMHRMQRINALCRCQLTPLQFHYAALSFCWYLVLDVMVTFLHSVKCKSSRLNSVRHCVSEWRNCISYY